MTFYADKETLEEMLTASYEDFKKWEADKKKLSYLRDASNKLVAVAENVTSSRLLTPIANWGEFAPLFKKEFKNELMYEYLKDLHKFFYQGAGYDENIKEIEYEYHKARKFFRNLVKEGKYINKKLVTV